MTDFARADVLKRLENGDYSCAKEFTLAMFSGKWKLIILCQLNEHGAYRFNELRRLLPKVTHKVLTNQLREMTQDQLITRTVEQAKPLKVIYQITPLGQSLIPIVDAMCAWGDARLQQLQVTPQFSADEAALPR